MIRYFDSPFTAGTVSLSVLVVAIVVLAAVGVPYPVATALAGCFLVVITFAVVGDGMDPGSSWHH